MIIRCIARPQARTFGILVEGTSVRHSARPRPYATRNSLCSLSLSSQTPFASQRISFRLLAIKSGARLPKRYWSTSSPSAEAQVLEIELSKALNLVQTDKLPTEEEVRRALQICESLARNVADPVELPNPSVPHGNGATSDLLCLEEEWTVSKSSTPPQEFVTTPFRIDSVEKISEAAYKIITDPKVFITPTVLSTYVLTQYILGRPDSFPEIFDLYAWKPIPRLDTNPIIYKDSNPNRAAFAIPLVVAHTAIKAAIEKKTLPLALSIIDASVCTPAFQRNKLLRKAFLPFSAFVLTPVAAYVLAQQLAQYQTSMDAQTATNVFFVGMLAYVGFTATIGVVAATTANDQMDRITWAKGTPLRDRWLREDERALVDRVADAWGFQDITKRGEEEGGDWEALREWAGSRGMVLDAPELMEGME